MSTNSRWTAVKNLYAAALPLDEERRQRYLDQNCSDPELRKEVEKLLLSESTVTEVEVATPPYGRAAEVLPPGTLLGHYRIQKRLGVGGMGLVYEALDQKLQRTVAIKIIQPGAVGGEDRERFLREAQAVSALNHPNIVTVYEAGQHEGLDFIAMERVNGHTLRQKIRPKGLSTRTALRYAVQIADALAAAHEAGIVHRDLKPGNVMVTDRDVVKVLDFGLAKRETKPGELDLSLTVEGRVLGTVAYMSPEQAQGHAVDARSDIFSFGSLLYEVLTGVKAFQQDSHVGTVAAILHKDPPPLRELTPAVPSGLARVVAKCLQKQPRDRWQDMQDLKLVLSGLLEDLETPSSGVIPAPLPSQPRWRWFVPAAVVAVGLAIGALAMYAWMRTQPVETVNEPVYRMVTADNGLNDYPALSRDGKFIAFSSDRAGGANLDIWLLQIGGREMIRLTKDPADETDPSFSPDGTRIAYRSERDGGGIYLVQTLGGDPELLVPGGRNPRYSPDGKWIAYWAGRSEESTVPGSSKVYLIDASGGQPRPVQPAMSVAQFPIWSPQGDALLVYGATGPDDSDLDYWVLPVNGGEPTRTGITRKFDSMSFPRQLDLRPVRSALDWSGIKEGRLITPRVTGDSANLWESVLDRKNQVIGLPRRLTSGPGGQVHGSRAITDTTDQLGFSDVTVNHDVWSAGLDPARAADPTAATRLTDSIATEWAPSISQDGLRLLFTARRAGLWSIVLRDLETGRERVLTSAAKMPPGAAISGDGSRIMYSDVDYNLQSMSVKGGDMVKLSGQRGTVLSFSSSARFAAFEPVRDEDVMVFDTSQNRALTLATRPNPKTLLSGTHLSPDEKWVVFHSVDHLTRRTRIWIAAVDLNRPVPPQEWIPVTDEGAFAQDPTWASDGLSVYFSAERDGFRCFWGQRLDPATRKPSGDPYPLRHFHSARQTLRGTVSTGYLTGLSAAPGRLIYSIGESKGNIWMMEAKKRGR